MKIQDGAAVIGLVVLLTWLLIRGLGPADPGTQAALRALDHYVATQSALHRDVLRARAGLLRNYDPIVDHMAAMNRDLGAIRGNLEKAERTDLLVPIVADLREQEALAERFKSGNALLQNSLSYFGLFSSRLSHGAAHTLLSHTVDGLAGDMLHLTLDTSDATIKEVGAELAEVQSLCRQAACPQDAESLLAHGRLLHDLLPKVDRGLAALVRTDRRAPVERLRIHLQQRERSVEAASVRFRLLLYGVSLLLLVFLLKGEVKLRRRAADLRRQVALEHAVASLSARLIGGGACTTTLVKLGLEQLGQALGAKRAYFYRGRSGTFCAWPAGDGDDRRAAALHLARRQDRSSAGIVHLRIGDPAVGPVEAALLRSLGTASWIAVLRSADSGSDCFLAFDMDAACGAKLPRQLTVLQTGFDAICLAFDHEQAEAERQRLAEQLAHARRMETIGAFASGIAHNFNNLIGAIGGYAEMAQTRLEADNQDCQYIDQIQLAAERGRNLIDGLLDYGRRRQQRREPVDLTMLVNETRELAEAALGPHHAIEIVDGVDRALVVIDPAQVQQVLLNLCRNAAQAMGDSGTIRIRTGTSSLGQPLLHPHGPVSPGRYATVTVQDSGSGIAPGEIRRLFEPFYTTKADGNGLGLATAREIIADSGGAITIDSQPGVGTEARVWLPLSGEAHELHAIPASPPAHARGNGEGVLLMVEDPARRLSNEDMVAALGYEPIGVETPERLLELVEQGSCGFDAILICEAEITERSWALLAQLRSLCPGVPRILAIGSAAELQAGALAQAGVSAVIQYPPRAGELSSALQRCLNGGSIDAPFQPQVAARS